MPSQEDFIRGDAPAIALAVLAMIVWLIFADRPRSWWVAIRARVIIARSRREDRPW